MTFITQATRILTKDPVLQRIMGVVTLPNITESRCIFKKLVQTIIYQQLSDKAAESIYLRFIERLRNEDYKPKDLLQQSHEKLRSCGLSNQKAKYVKNIAQYFLDKDLSISHWKQMKTEMIRKELIQIKGVGPWTVDMICIFALEKRDILPTTDLTIKNAMIKLYNLKDDKKNIHKNMLEVAENWRPFRSVASRYLWTWTDQMK